MTSDVFHISGTDTLDGGSVLMMAPRSLPLRDVSIQKWSSQISQLSSAQKLKFLRNTNL